PALGGVDLQHAIEILRAIEDHTWPDALPGLRRASATWRDRDTVAATGLHRGDNFLYRGRQDDPERHDLVNAGIGGVESAAEPVEARLAGAALGQRLLELGDIEGSRGPGIGHGE